MLVPGLGVTSCNTEPQCMPGFPACGSSEKGWKLGYCLLPSKGGSRRQFFPFNKRHHREVPDIDDKQLPKSHNSDNEKEQARVGLLNSAHRKARKAYGLPNN